MKKCFYTALCIIIAASILCCNIFAADKNDKSASLSTASAPAIEAKSGVLIEAKTGTILFEKEKDTKMAPASVTKIMTLLLTMEAIESGKLNYNDKLKTSTHASQMGGSQIWLKENEEMSVNDLLKAACIASANDAATSLAEHIGGSQEVFVKMMNDKAAELGMTNTVFKNPTGLDAEGHLTTAYDIALMSRELLKHKDITKYTSTWMDTLREGTTELVNTNKLVRFYKGCTGLKTGTTSGAGSCVSVSATRDGMELIAVVMGCTTSKDRFNSARTLLDYGFANFSVYKPTLTKEELAPVSVSKGTKENVNVMLGESDVLVIPKGQDKSIKKSISMAENLAAPVMKGQAIGKLTLTLNEEELASFDIVSCDNCEAMSFWQAIKLFFVGIVYT